MSQIEDIARGLAANIATLNDPDTKYLVSPFWRDSPQLDHIQVSAVPTTEFDVAFQKEGVTYDHLTFEVEALLLRGDDISAQKRMYELQSTMGDGSLKQALESDQDLTSRLEDDGTVTADQPKVADIVHVSGFTSTPKFTLDNGVDVWLATWTVDVWT